MRFLNSIWFPIIFFIAVAIAAYHELTDQPHPANDYSPPPLSTKTDEWQAPDINQLGDDAAAQMIRYGKDLIVNTAKYLGPKGAVLHITNGMNCQNCHIEAGAKSFGNCLSAVAANYPQFKPRSGRVESIEFRINDCMKRSLNGQTIDSLSKEMQAMKAYITWLGAAVPKGKKPAGAGVADLALIARAAEPAKGAIVYQSQCSRCHGTNGEGQALFDSTGYAYPPLWGMHSYNTGAGLYRISRLAAYAKDNMPFGIASHENPQLSNEEAWDVAAFINSRPRPDKKFAEDWPDIAKKSFDYPYGPYKDGFTEQQHKYGPFQEIKKTNNPASIPK